MDLEASGRISVLNLVKTMSVLNIIMHARMIINERDHSKVVQHKKGHTSVVVEYKVYNLLLGDAFWRLLLQNLNI